MNDLLLLRKIYNLLIKYFDLGSGENLDWKYKNWNRWNNQFCHVRMYFFML